MFFLRTLAALAAALCLAPPASAQSPLALATFAGTAPGTAVAFEHRRTVDTVDAEPQAVFEERLRVEVTEGAAEGPLVTVRPDGVGTASPLPPYPAGAGHPVVLLFLESTVRTMAAATGGNPDYIRGALRDRLWRAGDAEPVTLRRDGAPLAGQRVSYRPFAEDPNRAEMGPFAELELRFTLSDAVPGGLVAVESATGPATAAIPALGETIRLAGTGGD